MKALLQSPHRDRFTSDDLLFLLDIGLVVQYMLLFPLIPVSLDQYPLEALPANRSMALALNTATLPHLALIVAGWPRSR